MIKEIAHTTTYEISLDGMKNIIARYLGIHPEKITIKYKIEEVGGDPMDRFPGIDEVTKIIVTVDNK